ncbi:MAG: hypothetical protein KA885_06720 [Spirochaetes bacterium]|nr:hypothetical protein [Spirochaetota bacterium]
MQKSILLVNKDRELLTIFSILASDVGMNLAVALDRETALREVNESTSLIVVDMTDGDMAPYELLDIYCHNNSDIPRLALMTKDMFNDNFIEGIYHKVYDVIVIPIVNFEDFQRRIFRTIDNYNLYKENLSYQNVLIDKSFKAGALNITSSLLNKVDNYIDQLLAELYLWKDKIISENNGNENLTEGVRDFVSVIENKILSLEEIIQINETLLEQNGVDKEMDINEILEDIRKVMKYIFDKKFTEIELFLGEIKTTKLDSSKIVQIIFYFLMESINSSKNIEGGAKDVRIHTKIVEGYDKREYIVITFEDNCGGKIDCIEKKEDGIKKYNNEVFSIRDIRNYLETIKGEIETVYAHDADMKRKIILKLPVL